MSYLQVSDKNIRRLPEIKKGINRLWCNYNKIRQIPKLCKVQEFSGRCNRIKSYKRFTIIKGLSKVELFDNKIKDFSFNELKYWNQNEYLKYLI